MRKHHISQSHRVLLSIAIFLGIFALLVAVPSPEISADPSPWSYRYYKDSVELTFYPFEILLYDPTTPASASLVNLEGRRLLPNGDVVIAPNVKVLPIRTGRATFNDALGRCTDYSHPSWVADGITQAADLGARVTSLSWNWSFIGDPAMQEEP